MDVGYLTRRTEINPNKKAIQLEDQQSWTYSELDQISNSYANKLTDLGIKKGDRVGILLYNCLEYFGLYFSIAKIGAVAVRINFRLSSQEFEYVLNDSDVKVLCFDSSLIAEINPIRNNVSVKHFLCLNNDDEKTEIPSWANDFKILLKGSATNSPLIDIDKSDPVMLMYTSGTTGRPKGAIWTHESTLWFATIQALKWELSGITMTTGPLYHVGAMEDLALPTLLKGGTVIITKSKGFKMERVVSVIAKERVKDCFLFPFMINDILRIDYLTQLDLSGLQTIYTGGDPLMPWTIEQLKIKLPNVGLVQVYGLTEGTPIAAALDPNDTDIKRHTVGKPMPLTEIKIVDDDNNRLASNEVGEILIKGPVVSKGYWNKPEETNATFVNGWCKTGDLGMFDTDGFLIISGRKKDMIRSGGENVYPAELEDLLMRHEGIKDVAVIGFPDPKYIESICAVIVKNEDAAITKEDVINYCKDHLANFKKPKEVTFVDELPRTPSGKIQKYILRDKFSGS